MRNFFNSFFFKSLILVSILVLIYIFSTVTDNAVEASTDYSGVSSKLDLEASPLQMEELNYFFDSQSGNLQTNAYSAYFNGEKVTLKFIKEQESRYIEFDELNNYINKRYKVQKAEPGNVGYIQEQQAKCKEYGIYTSEVDYISVWANSSFFNYYLLEAVYDDNFLDAIQLKASEVLTIKAFTEVKDKAIQYLRYNNAAELINDNNLILKHFDIDYLAKFLLVIQENNGDFSSHTGGFIYNERNKKLYPVYTCISNTADQLAWLQVKIEKNSAVQKLVSHHKGKTSPDYDALLNEMNNSITRSNVYKYYQDEVFDYPLMINDKHTNLKAIGEGNNVIIKSGEYIFNEDLIIPAGCNLIIENGTTIKLQPSASFIVNGAMQIEGKEGSPVTIEATDDNNGFSGMIINGFYQEKSEINYLIFKNSLGKTERKSGLIINNSDIRFNHCIFNSNFSTTVIEANQSNLELNNCEFRNNYGRLMDLNQSASNIEALSIKSISDKSYNKFNTYKSVMTLSGVKCENTTNVFITSEHSVIYCQKLDIDECDTFITEKGGNRILVDNSKIRQATVLYETKNKENENSVIFTGMNEYASYEQYQKTNGNVFFSSADIFINAREEDVIDLLASARVQADQGIGLEEFRINNSPAIIDDENKIIYVKNVSVINPLQVQFVCTNSETNLLIDGEDFLSGNTLSIMNTNEKVIFESLELKYNNLIEQYRLYIAQDNTPIVDILEYGTVDLENIDSKYIFLGVNDSIRVVNGVQEPLKSTYAQDIREHNLNKKLDIGANTLRDNFIIRNVADIEEAAVIEKMSNNSKGIFKSNVMINILRNGVSESLGLLSEKLNDESLTNDDSMRTILLYERVNQNANFRNDNTDFTFYQKSFKKINMVQPASKKEDPLYRFHNGLIQRDDSVDTVGENYTTLDKLIEWVANTDQNQFNAEYGKYFDYINLVDFVWSQILFGDFHWVIYQENSHWLFSSYVNNHLIVDIDNAKGNNRLVELALNNSEIKNSLREKINFLYGIISDSNIDSARRNEILIKLGILWERLN